MRAMRWKAGIFRSGPRLRWPVAAEGSRSPRAGRPEDIVYPQLYIAVTFKPFKCYFKILPDLGCPNQF